MSMSTSKHNAHTKLVDYLFTITGDKETPAALESIPEMNPAQ